MKRKIIRQFLIILLFVAAFDIFLQFQLVRQHTNDQMLDASLRLSAIRARIEKDVTSNLLLVQGTANYISVTADLTEELFARYARAVLAETTLLKNLTGAPDYVMRFVYPLEGNEAILGINYRELPGQWEQAHKAEESRTMVVAGPLKLMQGGTGLIGRAPVFVEAEGGERFWGIVSSVIDADRLFENARLNEAGLDIAIRGTDGKGAEGDVFLGNPELFQPEAKAVLMPVSFPSGNWIIAAIPKDGWSSTPPFALLTHGLLALLMLVTAIASYRAIRRSHIITTTQESLNQAQAIAHLGNWELDHVSGDLWWSDETYRIFGVDSSAFNPTPHDFFTLVHPDDQALVEQRFAGSLNSCEKYSVDHRIIRPDGSLRHVQERGRTVCDDAGTPLRTSGTVLDITARKLAEEALKAGEERMRAMSESSYDALIMIDSDDIISFWSPAAERMFGWTREEAIGQSMHRLIVPEDERQLALEGLKHFARTGEGPVIGTVMEFMALRKNGDLFPVERSVSAFRLGESHYAVGSLRDITERKRVEHELKDYADRLALASRAGAIGVWEWNVQTGALDWDEQMFALYSVGPGEFSGLFEAWRSRVHPDDVDGAEKALRQAVRSTGQWEWDFRVVWPGGEIRHIKAAALIQKDDTGEPEHMIGVNWDVTEARVTEERLRLMATTDSMTGLYNRRRFMELADREIERSRRFPSPFSIIMFDADKFKLVNDTYGHDVGDTVLKSIASTAADELRDVDILGRLGGEEFAAGLPGTDAHGGMLVAERLRAALEKAHVELPDGRVVEFTVSLGVSEFDASCADVEGLLKRADLALYQAKENGRNRVEAFTPEMTQNAAS